MAEPTPSVSNGNADKALNTEDLITAIKQHPLLYSNAHAEFLEKQSKQQQWTEVCQAVFKDWNKFCPREKREKVREVQAKWLKLKNSFLKSYGGVRKMSSLAKKKKDEHHNNLSFLIQSPEENVDNNNEEESQEAPQLSTAERMVVEFAQTHEVKKTPVHIPVPQFQQPIPSGSHEMPIDEHLYFALTMIPSLRRLTADQKFIAWISIIEIIQKAGEMGKNINVLQNELRYPTAGTSGSQVPVVQLPPVPGTLEPEEPMFPASHGRPTNPQGEIMYLETDHESLDEA